MLRKTAAIAVCLALSSSSPASVPLPPGPPQAPGEPPAPGALAPESGDTDNGWPRTISDGEQITVYQPDVESWKGNQILERAAVSVATPSSAEPSYGVIWISARTEVDRTEHLVTLEDVRITRASFPGEQGKAAEFLKILTPNLPPLVKQISLDRLQAGLALTKAESKTSAPKLSSAPPRILYSDRPGILLLIDGDPALRATDNPGVLRVINTRALVLLDQSDGHYYFYMGDRWMRASAATGPWTEAPQHPGELDSVKKGLAAQNQVDLLNDPNSALMKGLSQGVVPAVYASTRPAELIETSGAPALKPLAGTNLLVVQNTANDIFLNPADGKYYVLISGRWYRSSKLGGPWANVSARKLPSEFARIPETNPKATVLASVAGTPEAQEAGIANSIPQTATVDRAQAAISVTYDGPPRFEPIPETQLFYASNSPVPVIEVSPQSFYAVQNGVWFASGSPAGPWAVAAVVPPAIYTIPPSSPLYYVTFVKVYGSTPEVVYEGYTPGYFGSYMDADGVVVYGTGYSYGPWIGSYWYGYPVTYGFGWRCGPGFGWGLTLGVSVGFFAGAVVAPWWGPWRAWTWGPRPLPLTAWRGVDVYRANVYRAWPGHVVRNTWDRHEVANRFPSGGSRANSLYAGRNGQVYRYGQHGWEEHAPQGGWRQPNARLNELEQSRVARGVGENRWNGFRQSTPSGPRGNAAGIASGQKWYPSTGGGGRGFSGGGHSGGRDRR